MSKDLVREWLETYMFRGMTDRSERAKSVSEWLAGHGNFKSHSRHISRDSVERQGLVVSRMEDDGGVWDMALSVYHATTQTFSGTPAAKIVENHTGRAFVK